MSVVCPAFFRTNITETSRSSDPDFEATARALVERSRHAPGKIAGLIHRGVARGDFLILTHADGRVAYFLKRVLPVSLYLRLMARAAARLRARSR